MYVTLVPFLMVHLANICEVQLILLEISWNSRVLRSFSISTPTDARIQQPENKPYHSQTKRNWDTENHSGWPFQHHCNPAILVISGQQTIEHAQLGQLSPERPKHQATQLRLPLLKSCHIQMALLLIHCVVNCDY